MRPDRAVLSDIRRAIVQKMHVEEVGDPATAAAMIAASRATLALTNPLEYCLHSPLVSKVLAAGLQKVCITIHSLRQLTHLYLCTRARNGLLVLLHHPHLPLAPYIPPRPFRTRTEVLHKPHHPRVPQDNQKPIKTDALHEQRPVVFIFGF